MAYKSQGPSMRQGGTFMSKHNSSYMHKKNLLNDMPVDDHAGSPMNQVTNVYDDRKNKEGQTQSEILNAAKAKVDEQIDKHNKTVFTRQSRIDASKRMIDELKGNYQKKVDSVNTANAKMNKLINEMNKGNYPGSLQK